MRIVWKFVCTFVALAIFFGCTESDFSSKTKTNPSPQPSPTAAPASPVQSESPIPLQTSEATVQVAKVGINFEDLEGGDYDYNDAVLCFEGEFAVTGATIVSSKDQSVEATIASRTECKNEIEIRIIDESGNVDKQVIANASLTKKTLTFKNKSRLEVTRRTVTGSCILVTELTDPKQVKIQPDLCNTSGN